MIIFTMERRLRLGRIMSPSFLLPLCYFLLWVCVCESTEEFTCHHGMEFNGDKGAIIPKGDIIVEVGNHSKEVLCRFNSTLIDAKDVYFSTREERIPHKIVNSSTISTQISHSEAKKYTLYCKLTKKKREDKTLCDQMVLAGYPPREPENFSCISVNNENVNCSWVKPYNPITTTYSRPNFTVPMFLKGSSCPLTNAPFYTWCSWDDSERFKLRDKFDIYIVASNKLGARTFVYRVNVTQIVIPNKISAEVVLVGPVRAKVSWNLTYPMDVFHPGLFHNVEYRRSGTQKWENVTFFFHESPHNRLTPDRTFSVEINLPYGYTKYEFRVRIHTGAAEITEHKWSEYDVLSITTEPLPPTVAPKTSSSTFEVVEGLDFREIYVNFQEVDKDYHGGSDFHYSMQVYSADNMPVSVNPVETTNAYFKYKLMNFTEYTFDITPVNVKGPGTVHSVVKVPDTDCMPKKTEIFNVITTTTETGKLFSLYWVPSKMPNKGCAGAASSIESYTIFWCKKTFGDRCKEKLYWKEIGNPELVVKDLSEVTDSNITIYEKNITDLHEGEIYSFGVAANTGAYSSGIRWSSCVVDDTEPPLPPVTGVEAVNNDSCAVLVKWSLKCSSLSAVPLGFIVSYCKSDKDDFGHCTSNVSHVKVNSPAATELIISNLDPGLSYIFSVAVLSLIGEGRQSNPKMILLRDEVPSGPPLNFAVLSQSNTSVSLSWEAPNLLHRRGQITEYLISLEPELKTVIVDTLKFNKEPFKYTMDGLRPFTSYTVKICACTKVGCGYKYAAESKFKTKAGVPSVVENFSLDVSNWRLMWDFERCNSRNCSFEVLVPVNETDHSIVPIVDRETLGLHELNLACNHTEMSFFIRAKGQDDSGHVLYGNYTSVKKTADECPQELLPWWAICLITSVCVIITASVLLIMKCGWSAVMKAIKDCKQKIILPKGIQEPETSKDLKDFSHDDGGSCEPSFLLSHTSVSSNALGGSLLIDTISTKPNRDSVSSEEVQLIDSSDHDRHGRNLSGSSKHSSGQDSALMSIGDTDPDADANSSELGFCPQQETSLRQRSPFPPYVQHGIIPEKLPEGYVTARSVPSLPHLYKDGFGSMQQITPELNSSLIMLGWQNARRASTGYISMPDSDNDKESPGMKDLTETSLSRLPVMRVPGMPSYSRHSFSPDLKLDTSLKLSPLTGTHAGYVTLAEGPDRSPSPPSTGNDLFGSLKRPPSLPLLPKSFTVGEELPLGAYCHVGSRGNSANQGYVSASHIRGMPSVPGAMHGSPQNPYVTCGEAALLTINKPHNDIPLTYSRNPPYVELKDDGHWAHPVQPSFLPNINQRPPTQFSAPSEAGRTGRVGQLPRPNTTEATMGHRIKETNPSLSKQSSGYVSQETIPPCEAVVMSPKRLLSQATTPHTIVMSPSHQASMV